MKANQIVSAAFSGILHGIPTNPKAFSPLNVNFMIHSNKNRPGTLNNRFLVDVW